MARAVTRAAGAPAPGGAGHEPGWLVTLAGFFGQAAAAVGFLSIPLFAPSLAAATGLDERDFAFGGTFVFLAVGLSSPYTGALLRRFGSAPAMALTLVAMAAGFLVMLGGTWATTMLAGFLFGIAYGMYGPASSTLVATRSLPARRGLYMAIRQSGVTFAGAVAGRALPPLILAAGWWAGVFAVSAIMVAMAGLTLAFASLFTIRAEDIAGSAKAPDAGAGTLLRRLLAGYRLPMPLQAFAFSAILFAITHLALASFAYFYLLEELGYSQIAAGAFVSNVLIAGTLGRPLMGLLVDLTGSAVRVLAAIALLGALSLAMLLAMDASASLGFIITLSVVVGVSASTWTPIFMTAISNAAPQGKVGEYNGRAFSYTAFGWTLAAPVMWTAIELTGGYAVPFAALCVLEVLMAVALFFAAPWLEGRARPRPALRSPAR